MVGLPLLRDDIHQRRLALLDDVERALDGRADLGPAIKRALEVVKRGEPSLIDVVTQPR